MGSRAPGGGAGCCNRCGASIVWFRDDHGRKVPIDAETVLATDTALDPDRHTSHHKTCPKRSQTKRPLMTDQDKPAETIPAEENCSTTGIPRKYCTCAKCGKGAAEDAA